MCSDRLFFFRSSCHSGCTVLANREGWQVAGELVPQEAHIIHDVGSVCISTMWLFNFFLVKRNLKQELQVKETCDKREFNQFAILHHKAVLRYTLPPLPLHLLLIIIILLLLLLTLLMHLLFKEVWKAFRPSLLSCRGQAQASSYPRFQNTDRFLNYS